MILSTLKEKPSMKFYPEITYTHCKYTQILFLAQIAPIRKYIKTAFKNLIILMRLRISV